jgi:putative transposase
MSIRQRLYPNDGDREKLVRHCADTRFVWNLGLEQRNLWVRERTTKKINSVSQQKELAQVRRETWLGDGSSVIQQQALRDLDQAFQNWWKNPGHFGRPTWRKAGLNEGFRIVELKTKKLNHKWGEVLIPKVGWVKFRRTRAWSDIEVTKSARITMTRSGNWYVTFAAPQPAFHRWATGKSVGLDMGIKISVATNAAEKLYLPVLLSHGEKQRKIRLQRQLARQVKGSHRREHTRKSLAHITEREVNRRKDWIEQTTTRLVRDYDQIAIEDLKVRNMVRSAKGTVENPGKNVKAKSGLNREIHNQSWGMFRVRLEQKASAATSVVEVVAVPAQNTSRRCSACGHVAKENRKNQATFVCESCGYTDNADVNAAINVFAAGQAVPGRGGTPHVRSKATKHSGPMKRQELVGDAA